MVPFQAVEKLVKEFQTCWKEVVHVCFDYIRMFTTSLLDKRIDEPIDTNNFKATSSTFFFSELLHYSNSHRLISKIICP
jgi:hypothetical protein